MLIASAMVHHTRHFVRDIVGDARHAPRTLNFTKRSGFWEVKRRRQQKFVLMSGI